MKKIRIEKDITVRWSGILTNGEPVSLEGRDLKLYLVNPLGSSKEVTDFNVTDNNIQFLFRASEQKNMGIYKLKIYENYSQQGQTVLDQCEGFCLVSSTCQEGGMDDEGLDTETADLTGGCIALGVQGPPGPSGNINYPTFEIGDNMHLYMNVDAASDKDRFKVENGHLFLII